MSRRFSVRLFASLGLGVLLGVALLAAPVSADSPITHITDAQHHFTHTEYFPDDICGPRASTATFTTTLVSHAIVQYDTAVGRVVHLQMVETSSYTFVYDDPTIPSGRGHSTDTVHWNFTAGGADVYKEMFHDYAGGLRIQYRYHITTIDGVTHVEQEFFSVTGCP